MKKFLKWVGIVLISLILILVITLFVLVNRMNGRIEKKWDIAVEKINIPTDSASIAYGQTWVGICQDCHGEALEGKVFFDDPNIGKIYSPNLTSGDGGVGKTYRDEDWIRSVRHSVNPKGNALMVMPAEHFQYFSKKDLSCVIAYVKSVTPVDNNKGKNELPMLTKVMMQLGMFGDIIPAEVVKHDREFTPEMKEEITADYGHYVVKVTGCITCHMENMAGGKSPDPNSPAVPNLTPGGVLAKWSAADFIKTLRTGVTPENKQLNDKFMPWKHIGQLSDLRLAAIFKYLQSLPKTETNK